MKKIKKTLCSALCITMLLTITACSVKENDSVMINDTFADSSKISYSNTYSELKANKKNSAKYWREGMVSGNGLQGFVESGSPYNDTFIFQNMHFIMPNPNIRYCPETFDELETVKQNITAGQDIVDNASYDDVYRYHPGGQLRIELEGKGEKNYIRYTDYETSQVGVQYENGDGIWERKSFTSMADDVVITKLSQSSKGEKINAVLSFDDLSSMANFGSSDEANMKYKKITSSSGDMLALISHYPDYENSELKNGGYATVTYILNIGGSKEKISMNKNIKESQFCGDNTGVKITDAEEVYLITAGSRDYNIGSLSDFEAKTEFELINTLYDKVKAAADKYTDDSDFDYDTALNNHLAVYQPQFDAVTIHLEDSNKSNEELLKEQKGKKQINLALAQRTYYAGRYAYLCCSGYSTSRLYGMCS